MNRPSENLESLTRTFSADRQFFDELMTQPCGDTFIQMCIWHVWLLDYLHDIQNSLHDGGSKYGEPYQTWITSMIAGVAHSASMLMYLIMRGVVNEAAASGRRALEYLGMAAHLARDPAKANHLSLAETESSEFTRAFIRGERVYAERLKTAGIRYRFAGMSEPMAKAATKLYGLFSRFNVHGGTMSSLVSVSVLPTSRSCAFHNRSIEDTAKNLPLFKQVPEIIAIELADLVGRYGVRSNRVNEAGACVIMWLDKGNLRWLQKLEEIRGHFGIAPSRKTN